MPSARIEPAIPAIKRLKTYALDGTATGIGVRINYIREIIEIVVTHTS